MERTVKHKIDFLNLEFDASEEDAKWILISLTTLAALSAVVHQFRDAGREMGELMRSEPKEKDSERMNELAEQLARAQMLMFDGADAHVSLVLMRTGDMPAPAPADLHPMPEAAQ